MPSPAASVVRAVAAITAPEESWVASSSPSVSLSNRFVSCIASVARRAGLGHFHRPGPDQFFANHFMEQPDPMGFRRVDRRSRQQQPCRLPGADPKRNERRRQSSDHAIPRIGQAERRSLLATTMSAAATACSSGRNRRAVHRRDDRLGDFHHPHDEVAKIGRVGAPILFRRLRLRLVCISPTSAPSEAVAGASDDDRPHPLLKIQIVDRLDQLLHHRPRQRVATSQGRLSTIVPAASWTFTSMALLGMYMSDQF